MAQYEHLPIYRAALKLAIHLENVVRGFSRYNKYTLGSEMRRYAQDILGLIIRANSDRENRKDALVLLQSSVERLIVAARLCQETKGFKKFEGYATTVELAAQVARQNEGWLKSIRGSRDAGTAGLRPAGEQSTTVRPSRPE